MLRAKCRLNAGFCKNVISSLNLFSSRQTYTISLNLLKVGDRDEPVGGEQQVSAAAVVPRRRRRRVGLRLRRPPQRILPRPRHPTLCPGKILSQVSSG